MAKGILERLGEGVVLGDGGYVLELEKRGYVTAGPFTPEVVLEHPEAVKELHREFVRAGSDVLQALAFYASREKLKTVGYGERVLELNRQAVRLAREVAGPDVLVAANLSATYADTDELARQQMKEQLAVQVEEGVDFVIGEFFFYLSEALIALDVARGTGLPTMITVTFQDTPATRDGRTPADCARVLRDAGADIVGINCNQGPQQMLRLIRQVREAVDGYVAVQPAGYRTTEETPFAAGLPGFPEAMEPYQVTRFEMADFAREAKEIGINYIGGCCGTVATHIREMARVLGKPIQERKAWQPDYQRPMSATEEFREFREQAGGARGPDLARTREVSPGHPCHASPADTL